MQVLKELKSRSLRWQCKRKLSNLFAEIWRITKK